MAQRYGRIEHELSVMADSWFIALKPHIRMLLRSETANRFDENAHAASASLLSVLLLESMVWRAAYMIDEAAPMVSRVIRRAHRPFLVERNARDILHKLIAETDSRGVTAEEVTEVFVVRDCLVHDHLWELTVAQSLDSEVVVVTQAVKRAGGDKKYEAVVDQGRTRVLGISVIPTTIDRRDAGKIIRVVASSIDLMARRPGASISGSPDRARGVGRQEVIGDYRQSRKRAAGGRDRPNRGRHSSVERPAARCEGGSPGGVP
jgi:hypothetical protein